MSRQRICMITLAAFTIAILNCASRRMYIIKNDINVEELENVGKVRVTLTDGSTISFAKIEMQDDKLKGTTDTGQINEFDLQDIKSISIERKHGKVGLSFLIGVATFVVILIGLYISPTPT